MVKYDFVADLGVFPLVQNSLSRESEICSICFIDIIKTDSKQLLHIRS